MFLMVYFLFSLVHLLGQAEEGAFESSASPASSATASGPAVICHYCPGTAKGRPAAMTCLVCGASMCVEHLQPHLESPVFQSHPLVEPLADVSQWRCQEHQEMNKIFCRDCGTCVCTVCTVIGAHRGHACISVSEAEKELRVGQHGKEGLGHVRCVLGLRLIAATLGSVVRCHVSGPWPTADSPRKLLLLATPFLLSPQQCAHFSFSSKALLLLLFHAVRYGPSVLHDPFPAMSALLGVW